MNLTKRFLYYCDTNHFISGIEGVHDSGYEDRM